MIRCALPCAAGCAALAGSANPASASGLRAATVYVGAARADVTAGGDDRERQLLSGRVTSVRTGTLLGTFTGARLEQGLTVTLRAPFNAAVLSVTPPGAGARPAPPRLPARCPRAAPSHADRPAGP